MFKTCVKIKSHRMQIRFISIFNIIIVSFIFV